MALQKLQYRPGINTQATETLNSSGWSSGNLIRWFQGFLQKVGGWARLTDTPVIGIGRAMHAFQDLSGNHNLLLGTDGGAQVYVGQTNTLYTFDFNNRTSLVTMTAPNGSTTVTVTDPDHGASVGDEVIFPITFWLGTHGGTTATGTSPFYGGRTVTITAVTTDTWTWEAPSPMPVAATGAFLPTIDLRSGFSTHNVFLNNHGLSPGDTFVLQASTTFLSGTGDTFAIPAGSYPVASVADADNFFITYTFSTPGGGQARITEGMGYGPAIDEPQFVYDPWAYYYVDAPDTPQNWFCDNLGDTGLVSYTNGPIDTFTPPASSASAVLTNITTGPQINAGMFTAMPQAQVIAFGSETIIGGGDQDPLLVRFSDAGSYSDWTATSTNQAGSYRLSRGSMIVGGLQAPQFTILWTDIDLWTMTYIGPPLVYSFNMISTGCGLVSPKARCIMGGITYWMGINNFFAFTDRANPIPCDVWDEVFPNLDSTNASKCWTWANSSFNEIWFFYPIVGGTGECTNYAKMTVPQGGQPLWDYGTLSRTCGIDQSIFGQPLAINADLMIQQHETGYDADTEPMTGVFAQSGYADVGDGTYILFVDQIIPDFKWAGSGGRVSLTFYGQDYPGDPYPATYGPFTVTPTSTFISFRARKRQLAMNIEWLEQSGFNARLGAIRARSAPAGRRP